MSDLEPAKQFYAQALAPLGYSLQMEFEGGTGFGAAEGMTDFWLGSSGKDNGPPGLRPHYHEAYYAAFVHDADGNNVEAVCHRPA